MYQIISFPTDESSRREFQSFSVFSHFACLVVQLYCSVVTRIPAASREWPDVVSDVEPISSRRFNRRLDVGPASFTASGRSREVVGILVYVCCFVCVIFINTVIYL